MAEPIHSIVGRLICYTCGAPITQDESESLTVSHSRCVRSSPACSLCDMYIPSYDTVTYHQSCDQERRSDMAQAIGRRQVVIDALRARILELETALAYTKKPADGAAG